MGRVGWDGWGGQRGPLLTELSHGNSRHVHFMALALSLNSFSVSDHLGPHPASEKSAHVATLCYVSSWGEDRGQGCVLCRLKVADETGGTTRIWKLEDGNATP